LLRTLFLIRRVNEHDVFTFYSMANACILEYIIQNFINGFIFRIHFDITFDIDIFYVEYKQIVRLFLYFINHLSDCYMVGNNRNMSCLRIASYS